jgi:hypothetical protein
MKLNRPTISEIEKYAAAFDNNGAGASYRDMRKLVSCFPQNDELEAILIKVASLNTLYGTNIIRFQPVAKRIHELKIDEKILGNSPSIEIVNEIALVKNKDKQGNDKWRNNYSFATKYCHFHNENFYPIYDSYVDELLKAYNAEDKFFTGKANLRNFGDFKLFLKSFRDYYEISEHEISWPTLDKFLWLYGKEVFPKNYN